VVKKMPVHNVGGEEIVVRLALKISFYTADRVFQLTFLQSVEYGASGFVLPRQNIDRIECSILLSGLAQEAEAANQCTNCGSMNIMGPAFWGVNIPQAYQRVEYRGRVQIKGEEFSITGSIVYE
jgi:hypothetical protein